VPAGVDRRNKPPDAVQYAERYDVRVFRPWKRLARMHIVQLGGSAGFECHLPIE
jgi:hypothetical protein